jgi:hypothetical protein
MLRFLSLYVLILSTLSLSAGGLKKKKESDFQKNFNIAKQHLSRREINEALPYLLYLNKKQPENSNLKYLIGLCYAELEIVNPRTLQLLTESSDKASLEYDPNTIEERRVPIYVYYYLSIAYSQNRLCDLAEKYRNTFMEVYPHSDSYYPDESMRWINSCKRMKSQPEEVPLPDFPEFKPYVSLKEKLTVSVKKPITKTIKPIHREAQDIKTQILEYSTQYPIYGVQLGAFKEAVPVSRFNDLKKVVGFDTL